jgi:hypothetical protein
MNQALIQRAFTAFIQSDGLGSVQPTSASSVEQIGGLRYVVLRNGQGGVLAVYRVRNSGLLRRMRRWPPALALVTSGTASAFKRDGASAQHQATTELETTP